MKCSPFIVNRMHRLAFQKILISLLFVHIALAETSAQTWKLVTASVTFKIKMFGATVEGSFKGLTGNIQFDPDNLSNANIMATVDAKTLDTDNSLRNRHLQNKEDFFNVSKYPTLRMKSTKIEKSGNGYVGYFDLTIKSTTKNVKVPFTITQSGEKATFAGAFTINRRDWQVGGGTLGMADDATVNLTVNTTQANAPQ